MVARGRLPPLTPQLASKGPPRPGCDIDDWLLWEAQVYQFAAYMARGECKQGHHREYKQFRIGRLLAVEKRRLRE